MPPSIKKRIDSNQPDIVKALRSIPGVTVEPDHDDIIVGFRGATYWFEIKEPGAVGKDGRVRPSELRPSQQRLLATFTGHYQVVWCLDQILQAIGVTSRAA